jgi:DNA-binding response OmpR family regulator
LWDSGEQRKESDAMGAKEKTVLLVGTDRGNLFAMKKVLEENGFQTVLATSQAELVAGAAIHPLLTILDVSFYHPSLMQQLRPLRQSLPLLLIAKRLSSTDRMKALADGFTEALEKPIPLSLFVPVVSKLAGCTQTEPQADVSSSQQEDNGV